MFRFICILLLFPLNAFATGFTMSSPNAHNHSFELASGESLNLADYKGKLILVVNTASKCGFTGQYKDLEALHQRYHQQGLTVVGVPSKDFNNQEFDTVDEVVDFTQKNYNISFPITSVSKVKGSQAHSFYQWANKQAGLLGSPKWNFHKYLINANGELIEWFSSATSPSSNKIINAIERELETL